MVVFQYSPLGSFFLIRPQCSRQLIAQRQIMARVVIIICRMSGCRPKLRQMTTIKAKEARMLRTAWLAHHFFPLCFSSLQTPSQESRMHLGINWYTVYPFLAVEGSSQVATSLWCPQRWWCVKCMQKSLDWWMVASTLQNLPGLCMISWATSNCAAARLEAMKTIPTSSRALPQQSSKVCMLFKNLKKLAQSNIMAAYRAVRKQPSLRQSYFLSFQVGFLSSRLKIQSRMGKRQQTIAMQGKGLGLLRTNPLRASRARVQQGRELMIRLSLPKMSTLFRGRALQRCTNNLFIDLLQTIGDIILLSAKKVLREFKLI